MTMFPFAYIDEIIGMLKKAGKLNNSSFRPLAVTDAGKCGSKRFFQFLRESFFLTGLIVRGADDCDPTANLLIHGVSGKRQGTTWLSLAAIADNGGRYDLALPLPCLQPPFNSMSTDFCITITGTDDLMVRVSLVGLRLCWSGSDNAGGLGLFAGHENVE